MNFFKAKFALLCLTLILSGFVSLAFAQNILKFATSEDIAIAFYKAGNTVPNFERWIKETEPYNLTPWAGRAEMMQQEKSRLQLAYRNFDKDKDFLNIRTFVLLDPKEQTDAKGQKTYGMKMVFSEAPEALYFPYEWLGERIVVMPHKIDKLMTTSLTESQYDLITRALPSSAKNTMIVQLRATEGDVSKPYKIDGLSQWVLKAEVVALEVWSKQGSLLWEYTAPWYVSPRTKKLNNLYNDRPAAGKKGAVKSLF